MNNIAAPGPVRFHEEVTPYLVPITSVTQHPDNPNNGDIDAIADSIQLNGFYSVCIGQKSTGHLIAGNHRYEALLRLRADKIPVVFLDIDDDTALAILVGDNATAALAVRDEPAVSLILKRLIANGFDLRAAGYNEEREQQLVHRINTANHMNLTGPLSKFMEGGMTGGRPSNFQVVVDGYSDLGDDMQAFAHGDAEETVVRLLDLGYHAYVKNQVRY